MLDRCIHDVDDVARTHHALVVDRDIHEDLGQVDVLLIVRANQVVEGVPGDRQHRLVVHLGVVEPIEQVDAAGARRRQADAKPPGVLSVAAGGKRRGLFVAHLEEPDLVLMRAQRLEDAVHAIARQTEDRVYPPLDESLDQ